MVYDSYTYMVEHNVAVRVVVNAFFIMILVFLPLTCLYGKKYTFKTSFVADVIVKL